MKQLIQLFAQIALLRRGPQDLPASTLLLALTVSAYLAVNLVVSSVLPPVKSWPAQVLVDTLFTLAWYVALLKLVGRSERILQTATYQASVNSVSRSEEHTSELQSLAYLVCRLLLEKKNKL